MCFNKELSLKSFLVGFCSSILLIVFSSEKNKNINVAIAFFYIFVSLVQLSEFFIWSDIDCKNNLNYIVTQYLPTMVYMQPIVYGYLFNKYGDSSNIISNDILLLANGAYFIYLLYQTLKLDRNCTTTNSENHLAWDFTDGYMGLFYNIIMVINSINFFHNKNFSIQFCWVFGMLFLMNFFTKDSLAEMWCYSGTSTPFVILLAEKFILS